VVDTTAEPEYDMPAVPQWLSRVQLPRLLEHAATSEQPFQEVGAELLRRAIRKHNARVREKTRHG
jgi:hypothetical protein